MPYLKERDQKVNMNALVRILAEDAYYQNAMHHSIIYFYASGGVEFHASTM